MSLLKTKVLATVIILACSFDSSACQWFKDSADRASANGHANARAGKFLAAISFFGSAKSYMREYDQCINLNAEKDINVT